MKCPICKKMTDSTFADFPFCSERCRLIDLGKWSSEDYVISTPIHPSDMPANGSESAENPDEK
jgi:uncharacterized protein